MSEWHEELRRRLSRLPLRPELEANVVEELAQHLDDQVRERIAAGWSPEAARLEAMADLDARGGLAERLAAADTGPPPTVPPDTPPRGGWIGASWHDIGASFRMLRRRPAFAAVVIVTLALATGPLTAIVSVGNWLLWNPVPAVTAPHRLAVIWFGQWMDTGGVRPHGVSYPNLDDLRAAARSLTGLAGWQESPVSVVGNGLAPSQTSAGFVTANFFDVVGVRLAAGRSFTADEDKPPHGGQVVVISETLARRAFGSSDAALSKTLQINGRPMTIVGVTPAAFRGAQPTSQVEVWYPGGAYTYVNHFSDASAERFTGRAGGLFYMFIGRMATDATPESVQAELDVLAVRLAEQHPDDNSDFTTVRARVFPGLGPHALTRTGLSNLVRGLLVVGGILLALGCANVTNLLLSNGVRRQSERAVRLALGASRRRLVQQLLTESMILSLAGALLGVAVAVWLKQIIMVLLLPALWSEAQRPDIPIDTTVLTVTLAAALACGVLAGIMPAWLGTRGPLSPVLARTGNRGVSRSPTVRLTLAAAQLSLSLALVIGALLLVTTLHNFGAVELGFTPQRVTAHYLDLGRHGYTPDRAVVYNRSLLERLRAERSLQAVSVSSTHPFAPGYIMSLEGSGDSGTLDAGAMWATDGVMDVLDLALRHGRFFRPDEVLLSVLAPDAPVVISEALSRRLFGTSDAVGRRITIAGTFAPPPRELEVIGVMRDVRSRDLDGDPDLLVYLPMTGDGFGVTRPVVLTRSTLPVGSTSAIVEAAAATLDPSLPMGPPHPLADSIARTLVDERVFAWVLSLLGGLGFVLAAVGLYGLLTQLVGERRREFGIRLAVGAPRAHVLRLVLRQATWMCAGGGLAGMILAAWGSRLIETHLFGVSALDAGTYALAIAGLVLIVFAASLWPALSATRVDPVDVLRTE